MSKKNKLAASRKKLLSLPEINPVENAEARQPEQRERYLEHVKMTSFGKFANAIVGPFGPGLNVVYGPNEAGKTTVNELIKGVLFGWPSARGSNNPYRPEGAERVGSLFFRNPDGSVLELKRSRNADGIDAPNGFLEDIDQDTYETMFALTSDELLGLDGHSEVTARLLTAGAGTPSSPAFALAEVEERIRCTLSRSAQYPDSIPNLNAEMDRLRALVHAGREEADQLRAQQKQLATLQAKRDALLAASENLNTQVESLKTAAAQVERLDSELEGARASLKAAMDPAAANEPEQSEEFAQLAALGPEDEYRLRDALDDFETKRMKLDHTLDAARAAANRAQAEFEAASESSVQESLRRRKSLQKKAVVGVSALIAVVMLAAGAYLLLREAGLSFTLIGVALIVLALVIATAGAALALRPQSTDEVLDDDLKKKQLVARQESKNAEVCQRALGQHDERVEEFLSVNGLAAACGSVQRARRLLDQAAEFRHAQATASQNKKALDLQCAALRKELAEKRHTRIELCRAAQMPDNAQLADFNTAIGELEKQRSQTTQLMAKAERQFGEITERLAAATSSTDFDRAKFQYEEANARMKAAQRSLAVLFVAQRTLQGAIAAWDSKSQPEVYRCASRLFSTMTGGAWQQIRMNAEGELEVVDAVRTARPPHLLSLGTRQQLYLCLRMALLMTAQNVGRGLPVLCDDILVNFDDERRAQATRALAELAARRQVILFTCHKDVAALVRSVDPTSNLLEL